MVYSYLLTKEETSLKDALKELDKSFEKAHELYFYLMQLMVDLTDLQARRLDDARNKYLPSYEDLHPNTRFIDNEFITTLRDNDTFKEYIEDNKLTWRNDDIFLKVMLERVIRSKEYEKYMSAESTDFASDCQFWKDLMRHVILPDEGLADILENKSVYWNDDLETMGTFAVKTIKRFEDKIADPILPMYKDDEDSEFGKTLFTKSVEMRTANDEIIDSLISSKWDSERIAFMDRVIMDVAITEVKEFISIPTSVTLNEYIEIAKYYSTPKSGSFVNGVLNNVIKDFKSRRVIVKD